MRMIAVLSQEYDINFTADVIFVDVDAQETGKAEASMISMFISLTSYISSSLGEGLHILFSKKKKGGKQASIQSHMVFLLSGGEG